MRVPEPAAHSPLFSPREAMAELRATRRKERRTTLWPSHESRLARNRRRDPRKAQSEAYTPNSFLIHRRELPSGDRVAPTMVAPSMEVARYKPKFRCDGTRDRSRAPIACPVSEEGLVPPSTFRPRTTRFFSRGPVAPEPHIHSVLAASTSFASRPTWDIRTHKTLRVRRLPSLRDAWRDAQASRRSSLTPRTPPVRFMLHKLPPDIARRGRSSS